nr:hypothetical protein 8 [Legionellales bacterium]
MATKLTTDDVPIPGRQSDVISKTVRDSLNNLRTKINSVIDDFNTLASSTSTSEIIAARDFFSTLDDRLHNGDQAFGNGVLSINRTILDCENTSDLPVNSTDATAPALNSTDFIEGSYSLSLGKSGTASTDASYDSPSISLNFDGTSFEFSLYVADTATLAKISEFNIYLTPDSVFTTNYKLFDVAGELEAKWNTVTLDVDSPDSITGSVDNNETIQKIRFEIVTNAAGDTITSGDIAIDFVNYFGNELAVKAQTTPDMTVQVLQGTAIVNGVGLDKTAASNSDTITAPTGNPRWDLVTINFNNEINVFTGVEAASPVEPNVPYNHIKLGKIYHRVGSTSIKDSDDSTNSYIVDLRDFVSRNQTVFVQNNEIMFGVTNVYPDITLDGSNLITSIDYKIGGSSGTTIATATYTYTGNYVTSISTVYGAVTYTTNITYDGNDEITNIVTTRS